MTYRQMWTRRQALQGLTAATAIATVPGMMPRIAFADAITEKRLIIAILRGGMDGLAALAPYDDRAYRRMRKQIAHKKPGEENGVIDLDGYFGLHPALAPLFPLYQRGEMALAPAVGLAYRGRSHFDAQNALEVGTEDPYGSPDGWLNRAVGLLPTDDRSLGLSVGRSVPLILRGDHTVSTFALKNLPDLDDRILTLVRNMYAAGDPKMHNVFEASLEAKAMNDMVLGEGSQRMKGGGGNAEKVAIDTFTNAGKLIASPLGPRIAAVEFQGWDTHANQWPTAGGLTNNLSALAKGLAVLPGEMGEAWKETVVIVVSEFGRTVEMNGTFGTDHGTGGLAFILGGAVKGGQIATPWSGLGTRQLYQERDVYPKTDIRAIFKGVLRDHVGIDEAKLAEVVFPNSAGIEPFEGLIRS